MELDQLADEGEAQAEPGLGMEGCPFLLAEALEDMGQEGRADALAGIGDGQVDVRLHAPRPDRDPAAAGRELDRVEEEVPEDLLHAVEVAEDDARRVLAGDRNRDVLGLGGGAHALDRRLGHGEEIDGGARQLHLPAEDARVVEQVRDEAALCLDAPIDGTQGPGQGGLVEVPLASGQDVDPARDDGQGAAQLMGDSGHELVLEMIRGLRALAGGVLEGEDRRAPLLLELAVRAVVDGHEEAEVAAVTVEAAGVDRHRAWPETGEVVVHLEPFQRALRGQDLLQGGAQRGTVPLAVAQRAQARALGLLRAHAEGVVVGPVRLLDAQLVVEDEQGLAHGGHDGVGAVEGELDRLRRALEVVHVHQHQHGAVDLAGARPVGPDLHGVDAAVAIQDLALADRRGIEHVPDLLGQVGSLQAILDVQERPAHVRGGQAEKGLRGRREPPHAQVAAHHDHWDVDAAHQVQEIVVRLSELHVTVLELLVERGQLFVRGLDLLLGRLQLFVDALQLLVAGEGLLVRRLQLLERRLMVAHDGVQVFGRLRQLASEPRDLAFRGRGRRSGRDDRRATFGAGGDGVTLEQDEQAPLRGRVPLDGNHLDRHRIQTIAVPELNVLLAGRSAARLRLLDGMAEIHQESLAHHLREVQGGPAVGMLQEGIRVPSELQDVEALVDHDAGRAVADEEQPIGFPRDVRMCGRSRREEALRRRPLVGRAGREVEEGGDGGGLPRVDPVRLVQGRKERRRLSRALRRSEHEEAGRRERVVERREHPLLQPRLQVDHHVPAADEVHARERRIPGHVVTREHAHLAQGLADLIVAVHLREEAPQALRRHVLGDALEIEARARLLQSSVAEVGAEDLEGRVARLLAGRLQEADGDRVRLLTTGAPGNPDPDGGVGGPVGEEGGEDPLAEGLEDRGFAEEGGDGDEAILVERPVSSLSTSRCSA